MKNVTVKNLRNGPIVGEDEVTFAFDAASRLLEVSKAATLMNFFRDEALKALNVADGGADVTAVSFRMDGKKLVVTVLLGMFG